MSDKPVTPRQRQADAAIYRKAALLLERRRPMPWNRHEPIYYACHAIEAVEYPKENHDLCHRMKAIYAPDSDEIAWLCGISGSGKDEGRDLRGRILALCFMAAMVEAGDA